jgi:uncharacterized protein YjbI with pentapeptide repeats
MLHPRIKAACVSAALAFPASFIAVSMAPSAGAAGGTAVPFICHGCNLNGVTRFVGTDLINAWFRSAGISNIDFTGADLTGADLLGANAEGAIFSGADLTNADFTDTDLLYATGLDSATLTNTIWSNTICPDGTNSDANSGTCEGHLTF